MTIAKDAVVTVRRKAIRKEMEENQHALKEASSRREDATPYLQRQHELLRLKKEIESLNCISHSFCNTQDFKNRRKVWSSNMSRTIPLMIHIIPGKCDYCGCLCGRYALKTQSRLMESRISIIEERCTNCRKCVWACPWKWFSSIEKEWGIYQKCSPCFWMIRLKIVNPKITEILTDDKSRITYLKSEILLCWKINMML